MEGIRDGKGEGKEEGMEGEEGRKREGRKRERGRGGREGVIDRST